MPDLWMLAAEGEELLHQGLGASGSLLDLEQVFMRLIDQKERAA
jgi:hypothetical protein